MFVDNADTASSQNGGDPSSLPSPHSVITQQQEAELPHSENYTLTRNLSRESLLAYAYHLYDSSGQRPSGMTAVPLANPGPIATSPEQTYQRQLLPLLSTLRSLHPHDPAVLLLLGCTHYALGDFNTSLSLNLEILRTDSNSVRAPPLVISQHVIIT